MEQRPHLVLFMTMRDTRTVSESEVPRTGSNAELITVPHAARELGVGVRHLRRALLRGELPSYRVGAWTRVRRADLALWVDAHRVGVAPRPRRGAREPRRRVVRQG